MCKLDKNFGRINVIVTNGASVSVFLPAKGNRSPEPATRKASGDGSVV